MSYYFSKIIEKSFDKAEEAVIEALEKEGFGVLTEIDVKATMKKKLDVDISEYKILGACNPGFAYEALKKENKIGAMLPCNVIIQVNEDGKTEVSAVDPVASMSSVNNPGVGEIAKEVQAKLKKVIETL